MERVGSREIRTVIDGSLNRGFVTHAASTYSKGLESFAYPHDLELSHRVPPNLQDLKPVFNHRLEQTIPFVTDIVIEINERSQLLLSEEFNQLVQRDTSLWLPPDNVQKPLFGTLDCVDKGIPLEAVIGVDGTMGRTLAGDLTLQYVPEVKKFKVKPQPFKKRLIHSGRLGNHLLIEPLIEHTSCGRRMQMLGNEYGNKGIPHLNDTFKHIEALSSEFSADSKEVKEKLDIISQYWLSLDRNESGVVSPDNGIYTGVIQKIALRQGLKELRHFINIVSPIEVYDKRNGDLITGLDSLDVLTDKYVLQNGGFTDKALDHLRHNGSIFSIKSYKGEIDRLCKINSPHVIGARTYEELQTNWLEVQTELVDITESLWNMYRDTNPEYDVIRKMVTHYQETALNNISKQAPSETELELIKAQLTHHLFHTIAYTHLLDTFGRGNVPGHHIEDHLAIGDHELGAKKHSALGQGDIDKPSAAEMFTGYSVLLHSQPGHEGKPVVVMIKLDTERSKDNPMTTEETRVAEGDFAEFLKLWPYFMVGDMIPYITIRGKQKGGVSRFGLSVVFDFENMLNLLGPEDSNLPDFVPANTSTGKVVLVPAQQVLQAGIEAREDLRIFRKKMTQIADEHNKPSLQDSYNLYNSSKGFKI